MTVTLPVAMTVHLHVPIGRRRLTVSCNLYLAALMFIYVYACR